MKLQDYVKLVTDPKGSGKTVEGLCGRIVRGTEPRDFETLTDDPQRKLVLLMGPDGLASMIGKSDYEKLIVIGYEPSYIVRKVVDEHCQFKLAVFPEGGPAKLATWSNVISVVGDAYPEVASKLQARAEDLVRLSFDEIEGLAGFDFSEVDRVGPVDPCYMTAERFAQSEGSVVDARAFLYFTVHLREQYAGDGWTYDSQGNRGLQEYIVPNKPLNELGEHALIDLTITIPNRRKAQAMSQKNIPQHFDPTTVGEIRKVDYQGLSTSAREYAAANNVKPAAKDKKRIALMIVDAQNSFCIPNGELFVGGRSGTGAVDDNIRLCEFIYENLGIITTIAPTMDTHTAMQIFHEMFWINDAGEHPAPMTMISLSDIENGIWKVNPEIATSVAGGNYVALQKHALHYAKKLSDGGKYALTIWPYHAMLGGIGHAIVPAIEEALFFHNIARRSQTNFQIKGGNPLTENYSIFKPEVLDTAGGQTIAQKNSKFLQFLLDFDVVIIAGQAKSHCVAWTIDDLLTEIKQQDEALAKKVYLLEDCTSPVVVPGIVDFTDQADAAFTRFADSGMHVVKSTDPIATWPGF